MYRRFGILHARLLLDKQVELTELESQLATLDHRDDSPSDKEDNRWRLYSYVSHPDGDNTERRALVELIDNKMKAYGMPIQTCQVC